MDYLLIYKELVRIRKNYYNTKYQKETHRKEYQKYRRNYEKVYRENNREKVRFYAWVSVTKNQGNYEKQIDYLLKKSLLEKGIYT